MAVVDVFAVRFEGVVQLLFAEMEGFCPGDVAVLEEHDVRVLAVVSFLEYAVVEAGVDHQQGVGEIEGVGDGVFIQQYFLLVLPELLGDPVQVDDAVVY